jgi:hypothetical protein
MRNLSITGILFFAAMVIGVMIAVEKVTFLRNLVYGTSAVTE